MKFGSKITDLFSDRIWEMDTTQSSRAYRRVVRFIKLVRITFGTFAENRMGFQCVALSYFVTLALVPFCAFIFAISGGLGLSEKISEVLHKTITAYPELVDMILEKSNNILGIAQSGAVGLVSALFFLWTILWMMFQVERVFNNVWGIRKIPRKIYKRFGFYFLVLFLSPFLVLIFGTGIVYYTNATNLIGLDLSDLKFIPKFLGYLGLFILSTFTMSVMYKYIPAAKVKYKNAFKSAIVASVVFVIFQYLYLETQVFVARLNSVYGVLAAIPLFLIWLNFSWQIIIYGAELTYGYENVDSYHISEWDTENK